MSIQEFPLAWRWTQPSHSVLSPDVLADIRPLPAAEAADISTATYSSRAPTATHAASEFDAKEVIQWLRRVQPDLHVRIYVSWSKAWAVEMSWDIFTRYWENFCYSASDDVTVVPVSGTWQLVYHHYEQFDFVGGS